MNSIEAAAVATPAGGRGGVPPDATTAGDSTALAAVLAHTLLNSLAVVRGGTELLARHHETLPAEERHEWYRRVDEHAELLASVLERVAQGRLADALALSERGVRAEPARRNVTARRGRGGIRSV